MSYKTIEERKQMSMDYLLSKDIQAFESLPYTEPYEDIVIRSKEEIVQRALALMFVAVYAEGMMSGTDINENKEFIKGIIDRYDAHNFFSPKEKAFLESNNPTQQEGINFTWQYEPFSTMLWALGLISTEEALDVPETICDVPGCVRIVQSFEGYEYFLNSVTVIDKELIFDQTDIIYRYDWVCVDDRINGINNYQDVWGIVMERHKSFNWLTSYGYEEADEWDFVSTDT